MENLWRIFGSRSRDTLKPAKWGLRGLKCGLKVPPEIRDQYVTKKRNGSEKCNYKNATFRQT